MQKVAVSKTEYQRLRRHADAYRRLAGQLFEQVVRDPIEEVVVDFRKTNRYTEEFLHDLEDGLRKSSYSRK